MKWNEEDRSLHGAMWLGIFKQATINRAGGGVAAGTF
jgi:hypothetical protein